MTTEPTLKSKTVIIDGQKMYHEKDVLKFIKGLKEEIYEDDLLGWRNKTVLRHYTKMIDELLGAFSPEIKEPSR